LESGNVTWTKEIKPGVIRSNLDFLQGDCEASKEHRPRLASILRRGLRGSGPLQGFKGSKTSWEGNGLGLRFSPSGGEESLAKTRKEKAFRENRGLQVGSANFLIMKQRTWYHRKGHK